VLVGSARIFSFISFAKQNNKMKDFTETKLRSIVKTITYRLFILTLDFTVIYWLTKRIEIAFGFMLVSNFYTTIAYYFHERIWNKINWRKENKRQRSSHKIANK
jgi:uncharacterized membrane protein